MYCIRLGNNFLTQTIKLRWLHGKLVIYVLDSNEQILNKPFQAVLIE
jgi:hypothetical protein